MTSTQEAPVVYVVTALQVGDDPVSPSIVGIYTSPQQAVANARRCFATISSYYQNGAFLPESQVTETVFGRCDETETFLTKGPFASMRVLLEVNGEEDIDASVISINVVPLNHSSKEGVVVPLLEQGLYNNTKEGTHMQDDDESISVGGKRLHVLMCAQVCDFGDTDPTIAGVFETHEAAIAAAKEQAKGHPEFHNDSVDQDNSESVKERGKVFQIGEDYPYGIALDTFTLNQDFEEDALKEIDLDIRGSGLYMHPQICGYEEIDPIDTCAICKKDKKRRDEFFEQEFYLLKSNTEKTCKDCVKTGATKECNGPCKAQKTYPEYDSPQEWYQTHGKKGICKLCRKTASQRSLRVCFVCKKEKGQKKGFHKQEWDKPDAERICKKCLQSESSKRAAEGVTSATESNKKPKTS